MEKTKEVKFHIDKIAKTAFYAAFAVFALAAAAVLLSVAEITGDLFDEITGELIKKGMPLPLYIVIFAALFSAGPAWSFVLIAKRPQTSVTAKIAYCVAFTVFYVYAFVIVYMIGWALLQSLKTNREFIRSMLALPESWLFSNFVTAFKKLEFNRVTFLGMFANSFWFSAGSTLISVFMHCVTGYIFARYKFLGKQVAFSFILLTLAIPIIGSLPSFYKIVYSMKLMDSPLFLITSLGGFGGNFLITYAFFKSIDKAYSEAAEIDGAGHLYIFLRVMLPLAIGPFIALTIVGIIGSWNNYETPILFLAKMPTLASGLYFYRNESLFNYNEPVYIAGVLISMLPILVLVSTFGNMIMKNMSVGGLKG